MVELVPKDLLDPLLDLRCGGDVMSKGTPRRGVRVEDALWLPALTIAKQRGENLSDIIRKALHDYINKHKGEK